MEYENMNRQEEYQSDGKTAVEDQKHRNMVENHAKQSGDKGNQNQSQQQPALHAQLLSVSNGMDDTQQQKYHGCQLVNMDAGQRHQVGQGRKFKNLASRGLCNE